MIGPERKENYDDGESFAAGDELLPQIDNGLLMAMVAAVESIIPDHLLRRRIRLAILREIFGEARDI